MSEVTHPAPPLRCLAIAAGHKYPHWWLCYKPEDKSTACDYYDSWWSDAATLDAESKELTVVSHPRNDPEAVEMIEAARKETK